MEDFLFLIYLFILTLTHRPDAVCRLQESHCSNGKTFSCRYRMFTILKSGILADVWKNVCSVERKWFEQIFLLFLHLNCLLMDHLAIIRMWFSVIPLWLLTSVPCCGSEVFSGTMSRLHWLWFSVSIELVLSNVISPHFSLLRKEISKKKNIEFRR